MTELIRKIILILLFLAFAAAGGAVPVTQAAIDELVRMYGLDTTMYAIDVDLNRLHTTEVGTIPATAPGAAAEPSRLTLRPLSAKEPLGLFTAEATVEQGGAPVESAMIRFRITKFAQVLVAADRIDMRAPIAPEQVEVRRVDVTTMYEKPLTAVGELAGMRAAHMIRKGTVLTTACVEIPPDVESGRTVEIVYRDGQCRIATRGTALQAGRVGEAIKVRNDSSGKVITARVADAGAVTVEP